MEDIDKRRISLRLAEVVNSVEDSPEKLRRRAVNDFAKMKGAEIELNGLGGNDDIGVVKLVAEGLGAYKERIRIFCEPNGVYFKVNVGLNDWYTRTEQELKERKTEVGYTLVNVLAGWLTNNNE